MSAVVHATFAGGVEGAWAVERISPVVGQPLAAVARLSVTEGREAPSPGGAIWRLRAVTSNFRYTNETERAALADLQPDLGRPQATRAALIPIRKTAEWWALAQDRRREIFEERSRHIAIGLGYLPAIARRLYHARDLGEPFDFLTWFDYAPADAGLFEELVGRLRETEEWRYVEREVDIRLMRE